MNLIKILTFFILPLLLIFSASSKSNLLISPTRISFDDRQRVSKVIVINNSDEYRTYRLAWQEKVSKPTGGYTTLPVGEKTASALSDFVRMSPSQVRLAPGERQIVKLALRKPKDLEEREYRSHLLFQALPNETTSNSNSLGIKVNMILSYSIPIILREGGVNPVVDISTVELIKINNIKQLKVSLSRAGEYSSFGKVEVFFKPDNNKEIKVSMVSDYSIYAEVEEAYLKLNFFNENLITEPGKLRIVYSGLKEYRGIKFAEKTFDITPSSSGLLN